MYESIRIYMYMCIYIYIYMCACIYVYIYICREIEWARILTMYTHLSFSLWRVPFLALSLSGIENGHLENDNGGIGWCSRALPSSDALFEIDSLIRQHSRATHGGSSDPWRTSLTLVTRGCGSHGTANIGVLPHDLTNLPLVRRIIQPRKHPEKQSRAWPSLA